MSDSRVSVDTRLPAGAPLLSTECLRFDRDLLDSEGAESRCEGGEVPPSESLGVHTPPPRICGGGSCPREDLDRVVSLFAADDGSSLDLCMVGRESRSDGVLLELLVAGRVLCSEASLSPYEGWLLDPGTGYRCPEKALR